MKNFIIKFPRVLASFIFALLLLVSLDGRSAEENRYMHENFGDLIIEKNGSFSTFGNKILYWKKRNEWREIYKFIQPSSFVAGKLAGLKGDDAYIDDTVIP